MGTVHDALDGPVAAARVLEVLAVAFGDREARAVLDVPGLFRDVTDEERESQARAWATARCQFRGRQALAAWALRRLAAMGGTMPEARVTRSGR